MLGPFVVPPRCVYLEAAAPTRNVSSTKVRERLAAGEGVEDLVGEDVKDDVEKEYSSKKHK